MKFKIILFISVLAGLFSCRKTELIIVTQPAVMTGITYPSFVYYGDNILNMPDSTNLVNNFYWYGMGANLQNGANLKVRLINLSAIDTTTQSPLWFYTEPTGWAVTSYYSDNTQTFTSSQTGKIDVKFELEKFSFPNGAFRVDFYENADTVTKTKYFTWN